MREKHRQKEAETAVSTLQKGISKIVISLFLASLPPYLKQLNLRSTPHTDHR
ncbi:hypothetical protein HMPREF0663_10261 [Hoylesella oralis ATCC 33269]|uniref:Uncharacterized protein n=1 Tax=Hoylesella oralis ATCC 33269 TaxID=873533 RepID=E7RMB1_9BACT|nr:hypothetical protein HMPREF0663_10261 [Hoylesella oralis ATCC 33269]